MQPRHLAWLGTSRVFARTLSLDGLSVQPGLSPFRLAAPLAALAPFPMILYLSYRACLDRLVKVRVDTTSWRAHRPRRKTRSV